MSKLIDSPFEFCPVCDEYVFLDQTHRQCAQEHHCENVKCPLKRFFVGKEIQDSAGDESKTAGVENPSTKNAER